ncbi:Elongation factor 4 [Buchnera aphidicola (Tetraneura ulmi)]|uniref:translation elongation factor 4 n=1 Tax=Buchnera aphidicola TaxID=9 RepID=UPI003463D54A
MKNIRNFSIIAHIDHGKSTLADCFIKKCGALSQREMFSRVLDSMDLEKERGITIKARSVTLKYVSKKGELFFLNLIDTPGHVNFSYEVSKSLSACEGALLVIDSTQGVEAQTVSNYNTAINMNLKIIPVINKIDLPTSNVEQTKKEIENILEIKNIKPIYCSAKTGVGISEILERVIIDIPSPLGNKNFPLQSLIIDSWFDNYLGVISLIRIKNGIIRIGSKIKIMSTGKNYKVEKIGMFTPKTILCKKIETGEVGWISCGIKNITAFPVGDTITTEKKPANSPLLSFKKVSPKIYAGLFPLDSKKYKLFKNALGKLSLNDSSLFYENENSPSLGFGFRCGFLGLLHMEIIQARLEREYKIELISTIPSVIYEIVLSNGKVTHISIPNNFPPINKIKKIREPIAKCNILTPPKYLGEIIQFCEKKRGVRISIIYHYRQVSISYLVPMSEVITNFFDSIKSISSGYASLEYEFKFFKTADLVKLDILINKIKIDSLSMIIHRNDTNQKAKMTIEKIKNFIQRQQFDIVVQAKIGNCIISRSTIKQLRKNVLSKCYGGDISRKKKLLQKQKEGKKKMKKIGNISLSKELFMSILKK